jgi:Winged helix-turn-helix DNA-binding
METDLGFCVTCRERGRPTRATRMVDGTAMCELCWLGEPWLETKRATPQVDIENSIREDSMSKGKFPAETLRELHAKGLTNAEICRETGLSSSNVSVRVRQLCGAPNPAHAGRPPAAGRPVTAIARPARPKPVAIPYSSARLKPGNRHHGEGNGLVNLKVPAVALDKWWADLASETKAGVFEAWLGGLA